LKQIGTEQTLDIQVLKVVVAKNAEHHGSARGGGVAPADAQHHLRRPRRGLSTATSRYQLASIRRISRSTDRRSSASFST
jgi:hypothetical protein